MNVESELKDIINRLYDIQDVSGPDLSKKIYEIILQCREAIGYRKAELDRVQSSRKPINSFRDASTEDTSNDYGFHWDGDNIYDKDGFHWYFGDYTNDNTGIEPYSSYIQAVKETEDSIRDSFTEDEIPNPEDYAYQLIDFAVETLPDPGKFIKEYEGFVKSSRKPIKSGFVQRNASMIMDKLDQCDNIVKTCISISPDNRLTKELNELEDKIDDVATHAEMLSNGDEKINSSKKAIKSSLEDRLVPYLEEFEEGFADTQVVAPGDEMDIPSRQETFFEIFKNDYNLSDDDINKLKDAVIGIWEATAGN